MKSKAILASAILTFTSLHIDAQQLKLHITDPALQKDAQIAYAPDYDYIGDDYYDVTFDANGNYFFTVEMPEQYNWVVIECGEGYKNRGYKRVMIERGKTVEVSVSKDKKGKVIFNVKSDNKNGEAYLDHLYSGTGTTAITGYGMPEERVSAQEGLRQLDSTMIALRKELKKIKPAALNDFLTRLTDATEIHYKLDLYSDHRDNHIYWKFGKEENNGDEASAQQYNNVCKEIKPNDPIYLRFRLNDRYIYQQMNRSDMDGDDLTGYGLKFISKMKETGITNVLVKHSVLDRLANLVLFESHPNDVDKFWTAVTDYAAGDTALQNKYADQIVSLRATKQGNSATDETFSDAQGNKHSFSEYKGKVLYVDLWATWCGPCQKEIPHFAKVAEHYKDNPKVQLISVSMDKAADRDKWLNQIERENPQWPQFILSKEEHDKISKDYGVQFIPRFILIKPDGTLANADAERPSNPKIYEIIDGLLK